MKFGLICEGVQGGADEETLRRLIKRLRPNFIGLEDVDPEDPNSTPDFVILPQGNKQELKAACGRAAKRLIETDRCERVGIVWDLYPLWGRAPDCDQDHAEIIDSLTKAGVNLAQVERLCVVAEIETWLLMDRSAIQTVIEQLAHPHPVNMPSIRKPLQETDPKDRLRSLFKACKVRDYKEHLHNKRIADVADLRRLRKCPSFDEFDKRVLP